MGIPKFDTSLSMAICRFFDIFQTHPIEQHIIAYTIFGWHDSYMLLVLQCGVSLTKAYLASCAFTPTPPRSSRSLHHVVWHPKEPKDELGSAQNWNGSNFRVFSVKLWYFLGIILANCKSFLGETTTNSSTTTNSDPGCCPVGIRMSGIFALKKIFPDDIE